MERLPRFREKQIHAAQKSLLQDVHAPQYSQEISAIQSEMATFFPSPLQRQDFVNMAPTDQRLFANFERQAIFSDHNIPHFTIVATFSALDIARAHPDAPDVLRMQKRAWITGMLHDVRKRHDVWGSIPPFYVLHGASAARHAQHLMEELHVDEEIRNSKSDVRRIRKAVLHHDFTHLASRNNREELDSLVTADRATIARLFDSKRRTVRALAEHLAEKRMRNHPKISREHVTQDYMDAIIRAASAGDILTKHKLNEMEKSGQKITPEAAYTVTLDTLELLGLMKSS